ncbi:hypothetical protein [Armatimonas sp.]|uniref:hypothetical protein n=1 Tax=Armatimonas sp. TaxID=1872638 RepID=UPI003751A98B
MKPKLSHALAVVAGAVLLFTLVRPETGWLARLHIGGVLSGSRPLVQTLSDLGLKHEDIPLSWALPPAQPGRNEAAYTRALAAHPADTTLQIAGALRGRGREALLTALRVLPPSAPRNAVLLRHACREGISLKNREVEQGKLSSEPKEAKDGKVDAVVLEAALADARQGAALDSQNGFFPTMEAVTLYGLKRDSEAEIALHRAALCPNFDDGTRTEVTGVRELRRLARGPQLGITEIAQAAATLFPHYSLLRALARLATVHAVEHEKSGDITGGLALRRDTLAVAEKLRDQSSSHIGTLVGTAMVSISLTRPGGAPSVTTKSLGLPPECGEDCSEKEREANEKKRSALRHVAHLRQWREFALAHPAASEFIAHLEQSQTLREKDRSLYFQATDRSIYGMPRITAQLARHLVSVNLLVTLVIIGVLGGLCALATRFLTSDSVERQALGWILILTFCYLLLPLALWRVRRARLALCFTPLVLLALGLWLEAGLAPWLSFAGLIQGLSSGEEALTDLTSPLLIWLFSTGMVLLLPALWLAALALISVVRRVSATRGLVIGAARTAVPVAALLFLAYAALLPLVAAEEQKIKQELQEQTASETAYLARLAAQ